MPQGSENPPKGGRVTSIKVRRCAAVASWSRGANVLRKLTILAVVLAMLLVATAALAQTMSEPGGEDELICLLPEGCDTTGDAIPDLRAGEPAAGQRAGSVQYTNQLPYG